MLSLWGILLPMCAWRSYVVAFGVGWEIQRSGCTQNTWSPATTCFMIPTLPKLLQDGIQSKTSCLLTAFHGMPLTTLSLCSKRPQPHAHSKAGLLVFHSCRTTYTYTQEGRFACFLLLTKRRHNSWAYIPYLFSARWTGAMRARRQAHYISARLRTWTPDSSVVS